MFWSITRTNFSAAWYWASLRVRFWVELYRYCLSLGFLRMRAILLLLRLGIVGKPLFKLKAVLPLLGKYTSISIVLPCPDNSMKASPSLIRGFLLYQEHWWPLGRWITSIIPQLSKIIRRTSCCTTWIWLCWRWCCQVTIWAFGMLSHRDGGGRRGLLVWLLVPAVVIKGWNRLCISIPKIINFLEPCPVFLLFSHIGLLCCIVQYSVVHNTICIERGNYL